VSLEPNLNPECKTQYPAFPPSWFALAVISGVIAIILLEIGLNLGWVYLVMGIIIGSAVFPLAACITWKKCSAIAAVTSSLVRVQRHGSVAMLFALPQS